MSRTVEIDLDLLKQLVFMAQYAVEEDGYGLEFVERAEKIVKEATPCRTD